MSLKRFSGWEPRTVYEYDGDGRMVASTPEIEWDATERAWMVALEHYRSQVLCPCGCGYSVDVAQDEMTEFKVRVPAPTRCWVRTRIGQAQEAYSQEPGARPDGLLWGAVVDP